MKASQPQTIQAHLRFAAHHLPLSATPRLDLELLLCHILQQPRTFLFAYPATPLSQAQECCLQQLLAQRRQNIPMAYLLGAQEFWGLRFEVNRHTLIPRSETELLVEKILEYCSSVTAVLDLGTGCGAIALALAHQQPTWSITASDISREALAVAMRNAAQHGAHHIRFLESDWFAEIHDRFAVIVSNPPYLAADDRHLLSEAIRHEPRHALVAMQNGMADLEKIIRTARQHLMPHGWVFLEHGSTQGAQVRDLFLDYGYSRVTTWRDIAQLERVTLGQYTVSPT